MGNLLDITVFFTLLLALTLLIERILEVTKVIYDFIDGRFNFYKYWTTRTQAFKHQLIQRVEAFRHTDSAILHAIVKRFDELILNNQGTYGGSVIVISADAVRTGAVRLMFKIFGVLLGILIAYCLHIDFVDLYNETPLDAASWQHQVHLLLSGIGLGLGSGPMHKIITTLERKQKDRAEAKKQQRSGT
ncbi:MAG: hypothetical protein OEW08_09510 [Gammaproteobacteria bacterium]|nr:hypothetical protein [Gammaproteobacteria bacterium]